MAINRSYKFFFFQCAFLFFLFFAYCDVFAQSKIKEANVAGTFYPENKKELSGLIQDYLSHAKAQPLKGQPAVLISPHAGYVYSGPVAAHGYAALKGQSFDTVIILAPSHYFYFNGASIYKEGFFQTPLGRLEVDEVVSRELLEEGHDFLFYEPRYFEREHSLEVQLPFLQEVLQGGFKIIPILIGDMDIKKCELLAGYLSDISQNRRILVVASTDLSHYRSYEQALFYDQKTIDFIKNFDIVGLWHAVSGVSWNVCGIRPLVVSLFYAEREGARDIEVLFDSNSGDITGDRGRVVGYLSALLTKDKKDGYRDTENTRKGVTDMLTKEDKKELLKVARSAIDAYLTTGNKKIAAQQIKSPGLNLKRGVFVTLHEKGNLRGCLGLFSSEQPLCQTVARIAIESSSQDYRFTPVKLDELKGIEIEISVLSEPKLIDNWRKIRLGTDGVIIRKGSSSGVFLPQVATETHWDLETFLGQLCSQKAGLPYEAFKDPSAKIYTFQADVFNESDF